MGKSGKPYVFSYGELFDAYDDCVRNKRNTDNARKFSLDCIGNVTKLCDEINDGTYEIGKSLAFVVTYPKPREVFAADFRDRVVHHLVTRELMPCLEEYFVEGCFSCMKGRGVLYGVDTISRYMRECTCGYTRDAWVLKLDVKSFFMDISKATLARMLDDFIVGRYGDDGKRGKVRELCHKIVTHHPEDNCERRGDASPWDKLEPSRSLFHAGKDKGLPIGNLTSQVFANFYMTKLDRYVKYTLGFAYYGRYVDDMVIISADRQGLLDSVGCIVRFARRELGLTIHPDKRYFQHYTKGVRFIGSVIKPNRVYTMNRTIGSLYHKVMTVYNDADEDRLDDLVMTVNSYLGYMRHGDSYNARKRFLKDPRWLDPWEGMITVDGRYRKINRRRKAPGLTFGETFGTPPG